MCVKKNWESKETTQETAGIFSYKLRYIVGFRLVETNPKPTIYRNLYENMGPGDWQWTICMHTLC